MCICFSRLTLNNKKYERRSNKLSQLATIAIPPRLQGGYQGQLGGLTRYSFTRKPYLLHLQSGNKWYLKIYNS